MSFNKRSERIRKSRFWSGYETFTLHDASGIMTGKTEDRVTAQMAEEVLKEMVRLGEVKYKGHDTYIRASKGAALLAQKWNGELKI